MSSDSDNHPKERDVARVFKGDSQAFLLAVAAAVICLAATGLGVIANPAGAMYSYLFAFTYWAGIGMSLLVWLMSFHAGHARWPTVTRRVLERMGDHWQAGLFLILFIPIVLAVGVLFSWVHPSAALGKEVLERIHHESIYLNVPFFAIRGVIYMLVWFVFAGCLNRWSQKQDQTGEIYLTIWQRRLGAGGLPLFAFVMTFAAVDWMMSLHPGFASTIWGLYYYGGSFMAAMGLLIITVYYLELRGPLKGLVTPVHYHNMGKLMFAFLCFWAYMAFSQLVLIWIADLPDEVTFYLARNRGPWAYVFGFIVIGHFIIPFLALLSKKLKMRPERLVWAAAYLMLAHAVDIYWLIMPNHYKATAFPHWTDLTAFIGIGAAGAALFLWRLRSGYAVPVRDPYLDQSLEYTRS